MYLENNIVTNIFNEKYKCTEEILGDGMCGDIKTVINKFTQKQYALKTIDTSKDYYQDIARIELEVLKTAIGHRSIIQMVDHYVEGPIVYIVMEKMSKGSLYDQISENGHFTELATARVVKDIAEALRYLHQRNIIHRDVKIENILCSEKTLFPVKLIDFGLASGSLKQPCCDNHGSEIISDFAGTPSNMAPEVLKLRFQCDIHFDKQCDIWSLGIVMYETLMNEEPFPIPDCECFNDSCKKCIKLILKLIDAKYYAESSLWDTISNEAKDLLSKLLEQDPHKRYTAEQVLEHPWIVNNS